MVNRTRFTLTVALLGLISSVAWGQSILSIPFANKAPIVDGTIKPGEWDKAAVTSGFKTLTNGFPAQAPVIVHMAYNNYALFIAWKCKGEPIDKLSGTLGNRDSAIWLESSIEFFISNNQWPSKKYAHFMVNHAGTIADEMCINGVFDSDWNPNWQAKTGKTQDSYVVEMAVPWSILEIIPKAGMQIRGNLTRNVAGLVGGSGEGSTWAKMSGGFHEPKSFGAFVLAGNQPVVQISQMPPRTKGRVEVSAKLTDSADKYTLSIKPMAGSRNRGKVSKSTFDRSGNARVAGDVGFGTNDVLVQTTNPSGVVIWSQTVDMGIPDITGKLANAKSEIKKLSKIKGDMSKKYGANSQIVSIVDKTIAVTQSDVARIDTKIKNDLTVQELTRLMVELDAPLSRSSNILAAVAFTEYAGKADGTVPSFFVTNPVSTQKVMPNYGEAGPIAKTLRISMIKNEFEPVQLVVCPTAGDLRNVSVTASALSAPSGAVIPADRLVVTPMAFVDCKEPTPGATYRGLIPDVLLPYKPVNVSRDSRQPYFVTIRTTATDKPGDYTGKITIAADGDNRVELPLQVKVYDVAIPVKSSLRTVFLLDWAFPGFVDGVSAMDARINYSKTMLEHRLSASSSVFPTKHADGSWDFSELDRYIDELVPLGQTTLKVPTEVDMLKATAEHMKKRGVWDLHYLYGWDEAAPNLFGELQAMYKAYLDAVPDVKVMQTGWNPNAKLKDLVKIWCPLTSVADMKLVRESQAAGEEVWWYVCCGPTAPYANLFVDYPGIDHRVLGWQTYQYDITGFLYWGLDVWGYAGNNLPLDEYIKEDYANWNPQSFATFNGDGYLCYPGKNGTAVPSMRLALLRDGFEDCDLLNEAKALAAKAGKAGNKLAKLIKIGAPISKSLSDYTSDGNVLLQKREEIMQEMERVQKEIK